MAATDSRPEATPSRPPLVSVVLPTFNRPEYLRIALESALRQTCHDIEIIVQDNASETDPAAVVAVLADPRVSYFRNDTNIGQTANALTAVTRARGKYVALLGDDDVWHPEFLATLLRPLEADDSLIIAFCDHDIIGSDGQRDEAVTDAVTRRWRRHALREGSYRPFDHIAVVYRSICTVSAALIRRTDLDWKAVPLEMNFGLDLFLAYLAARTGKGCYYTPQRLAQYRYHAGSAGSSLKQTDRKLANARDAVSFWSRLAKDERIPRNKKYFIMKLGFNALITVMTLTRSGDWRSAGSQLWQYLTSGFLDPRIVAYYVAYAIRLQRTRA